MTRAGLLSLKDAIGGARSTYAAALVGAKCNETKDALAHMRELARLEKVLDVMNDETRSEFERWCESMGWNIERCDDGSYRTNSTDAAWGGWLACADNAAAEITKLRDLCDDLYSDLLAAGSLTPKDCGAYGLIQQSIRLRRDRWARH